MAMIDFKRLYRLETKLAEAYAHACRVAFRHYLRKGYVPAELIDLLQAAKSFKAFNPDQPRVPAGNADGGQWTSGNGGEDSNGDSIGDILADIAPTIDDLGSELSGINTEEEPGADVANTDEMSSITLLPQAPENLSISQQGIDFIKNQENFRSTVYLDRAGRPTIGYGHLLQPGETFPDGLTQEQAEQLLRNDLSVAETAVQQNVKVSLTQTQYDALVSFTYNTGARAFSSSTLLRVLNQGDYSDAADQLLNWHFINHTPSNGLTNRRNRERRLFLDGDYGVLG